MRTLKFLGWLSVVIMLAIGAAFVMGGRLPPDHTATITGTVSAPQQKVWQLISDVSSQPNWRSGLKAITPLPPQGDAPCWAEVQSSMTMPLCADLTQPPTRRVVRIEDPKLPFGGTWTYELQPAGTSSTLVTITEHGTISPAIWRFMDHYVMGEDSQIKRYLADLTRAASQPA
jgi:hypothetical protein